MFGPGFTATWTGPDDAGTGDLQLIDNTGIDGTMVLIDEEGFPLVYRQPGNGRTVRKPGTYTPATDDTVDAAMKLVVTGTGTSTRVVVTDEDGTATTYAPTKITAAAWSWGVEKVAEPGAAGTTTYTRDAEGRVVRILAGLPDGYTAADCPATGMMQPGCRAMVIKYATATTATSTAAGLIKDQVEKVSSVLWDPATSSMKTQDLATYVYGASGRLMRVTDPRTGLIDTNYTWSGNTTRLATATPPGQATFRFEYETGGTKGARLKQVTRDAATAGGSSVALASFVYDLNPADANGPGLSAAKVGTWFQNTPPKDGFAVFGPEHPVSSTTTLAAGDWQHADLSFTDANGYEVNGAQYGAGQWLVTATDYDTKGNEVRSFTADGTNAATLSSPETKDAADAHSTQSIYNEDVLKPDGSVDIPAGTRLLAQVEPARQISLPNGAQLTARVRTTTSYDQGAPNSGVNPATSGRYNLPTTTRTTVDESGSSDDDDVELTKTTTGYDPVETGDASGWALGSATTTTTGGITKTTRYDSSGRIVEVRQPSATTTADAGTTRTVYYTAGTNPTDAACGNTQNAKAWAGLTCRVFPGAAPSSGPAIPDKRTTGYDMYGSPTTVVETSGSSNRTTTTRYDSAGRETYEKTTASIPGSTAVPGTVTKYDPGTGLVAYTGDANSGGTDATSNRITTTYDRWGRQAAYTNADGETGTTTYNTAGQVASFSDPKGSTAFTYDGTDADGKTERRGLATKAVVSRAGGSPLTFAGAYDTTGGLARQDLPGQITARSVRNLLGQETGISYEGQVTPVTATTDPDTGETTWSPGTPTRADWVGWTTDRDGMGRIAREYTSTGAVFNPDPDSTTPEPEDETSTNIAQAQPYDRAYTYDAAGRLIKVNDRTATEGTHTPDTPAGPETPCTVRSYGFTGDPGKNGARTSTTTTAHADGDCAGTENTTTTTWAHSYDNADRLTTGMKVNDGAPEGVYVYDSFGRQTTIPASDAPHPAEGNITLGYFDSDLPQKITQDGVGTEFTLDPADRRLTQTTSNATENLKTITRHYTDDSDNPSWVQEASIGAGAPQVTRFVEGLSSELGAMITGDGDATINLTNPHGDNITGITIPVTTDPTAPATALTGWDTYTEYGTPTTSTGAQNATTGPVGYGWLGGAQRATTPETAGLTLMGVRNYNPITGTFTGPDPVAGGNDTTYTYPNDPINQRDLDGQRRSWWKRARGWAWRHKGAIALTAVGLVPGLGAAAWGYRAYRLARLARASKGFSGGARSWRSTSRLAGRMWVGRGSRVSKRNPNIRISKDGRRQYRRPTYKKRANRWQSNFERRSGSSGKWTSNYHVDHRTKRGRWGREL